ncbi:TetR/AcrR family transcriptional regulator [Isoptericola sp. BMS4]|uniref:TetR/AcrR family transcriptional regulator n=1 Tax=Isoptericola sp. BMS4 TaxID=2527875 RepID=UPI00141F4262|nr:TetR/AcrR family transcriptional regulator [Isoptericola sp. BMS4]
MKAADTAVEPAPATRRAQGGRPRDASRDVAILDAARELLSEVGYEGTTMDAVAARAGASKATLYRRWTSKEDLAVEAVTCAMGTIDPGDVPDTGSLAGDLHALERLRRSRRSAATDHLIPGLMAEVRRDPDLARRFHATIVQPKIDQVHAILVRARERGEIPPERDLDLVSTVVPALISYRKVVAGQTLAPEDVDRLYQEVLVPLATAPADVTPPPA